MHEAESSPSQSKIAVPRRTGHGKCSNCMQGKCKVSAALSRSSRGRLWSTMPFIFAGTAATCFHIARGTLKTLPRITARTTATRSDDISPFLSDGFWETFVHSLMVRRGQRLLLDPSPVVTYTGGLGALHFCRRRFHHGRYFAARRSSTFSSANRGMRALAFPAVWLLLMYRITHRIWRNGRHRRTFLLAVPLVGCFVLAWAAGEAAGYVMGRRAAAPPVGD